MIVPEIKVASGCAVNIWPVKLREQRSDQRVNLDAEKTLIFHQIRHGKEDLLLCYLSAQSDKTLLVALYNPWNSPEGRWGG